MVIALLTLMLFSGCGDGKPVRKNESAQPEVLDKLDSYDPDKYLNGVD
jgi:hypothetical protein